MSAVAFGLGVAAGMAVTLAALWFSRGCSTGSRR